MHNHGDEQKMTTCKNTGWVDHHHEQAWQPRMRTRSVRLALELLAEDVGANLMSPDNRARTGQCALGAQLGKASPARGASGRAPPWQRGHPLKFARRAPNLARGGQTQVGSAPGMGETQWLSVHPPAMG